MIRRVAGLLLAASLNCAANPTEIVVRIYSEADFSTGPSDTGGITELNVLLSEDTEDNVISRLEFASQGLRFPGEVAVIRENPSARHTLIVRATEVFGNDPQHRRIDLTYRVSHTEGAITVLNVVFARVCASNVAGATPPGTNCGWRGALTPQNVGALPRLGSAEASTPPCDAVCSGLCADTQSDEAHCGFCTQTCGPTQTCNAGVCGCLFDERQCGLGVCARRESPLDCGECGHRCDVACRAGHCFSAGALSLGARHACATLYDTVRVGGVDRRVAPYVACWGENLQDQRGVTLRLSATSSAESAMDPTASIAAGGAHTCALSDTGVVRCWGDNRHGQLGLTLPRTRAGAEVLQTPSPARVDTDRRFERIAAGKDFSCASVGAEVLCWGQRALGQAGGSTGEADSPSPARVPLPTTDAVEQLVAGDTHACARTNAGELWCWGDNRQGQCGADDGASIAPHRVALRGVRSVAAGGSHTCAIAEDGIWCWGRNTNGELGAVRADPSARPVRPLLGPIEPAAQQIVAGDAHTCVLLTSPARVMCWGANTAGQLGAPTMFATEGLTTPEAVNRLSVVELAAGGDSTCARVSTDNVLCWGALRAGLAGPAGDAPWAPRLVAW